MKLYLGLLLPAFFLTACNSHDMTDLRVFVEDEKIRPRPLVETDPIIYVDPVDHTYKGGSHRSPFDGAPKDAPPPAIAPVLSHKKTCVQPQTGRVPEELENYPLDSLIMKGTLAGNEKNYALVGDPKGLLHHVEVNNYMGQNNGKVINITNYAIQLQEIHDDGMGCFEEKEATLAAKWD